MKHLIFIACLMLAACGKKEESKPATTAKAVPEKKAQAIVPEGKLPRMDPEKAKFIAVPSTPKDPTPKKDGNPNEEVKKADKLAEEAKK
jgi:hypothetical protein